MNQYLKSALFTIGFYILVLLLSKILDTVSPSGPCVPGLGVAILLALPFISGLMGAINIVRFFSGKKELLASLLIHLFVFCSLLIYVNSL